MNYCLQKEFIKLKNESMQLYYGFLDKRRNEQ
jgi:hypothetical protein